MFFTLRAKRFHICTWFPHPPRQNPPFRAREHQSTHITWLAIITGLWWLPRPVYNSSYSSTVCDDIWLHEILTYAASLAFSYFVVDPLWRWQPYCEIGDSSNNDNDRQTDPRMSRTRWIWRQQQLLLFVTIFTSSVENLVNNNSKWALLFPRERQYVVVKDRFIHRELDVCWFSPTANDYQCRI